MNTIVNKLLDVDRQARHMLDDAKQYYEKTIEEIDREREEIKDKYVRKAGSRLEDVRRVESSGVAEAVKKITSESAERLKELESVYEKKRSEWVDIIVERCISGEAGE